jgi:hypothetical protein
MTALETPQSYSVREECKKAAWQNGYRRVLGEEAGWAAFGSTTAQGRLWLGAASAQGPWFMAIEHAGVAAELALTPDATPGPGVARYRFAALGALYEALDRVYALAASLPDAPLAAFAARTRDLPRTTEAEQLVIRRIGQDVFRESLLAYWGGRCPLTSIAEPELLRASHIIPWAECESDAERLDVHNGLLLSALWDAAFDRGLVSFDDDGAPLFSPRLSGTARQALGWSAPLRLTDGHRKQLARHRRTWLALP